MIRLRLAGALATVLIVSVTAAGQKPDKPDAVPATAFKAKIKPKDLSDAGDGNPAKAPLDLVAVQASPGPKKGFSCATFSLDGSYLLLGTEDGLVVVWDLAKDKTTALPSGKEKIWSVAMSPNRKEFAIGGRDGKVVVRSLSTGAVTGGVQDKMKSGSFSTATYSPNGKFILLTHSGQIRVHTLPTDPKKEPQLKGNEFPVVATAFGPDNKTVAAGSFEGNEGDVRLWDITTGNQTVKLDNPGRPVHSLAFSPDGNLLATTHQYRNFIQLWNPLTGQLVRKLEKHTATVRQAVFTPKGDVLVYAGEDGTVRAWNPATGEENQVIAVGPKGGLRAVAVSPEGAYAAAVHAAGHVYVLRLN